MSTLAAIEYPDLGTAERAWDELIQLTRKGRACLCMAGAALDDWIASGDGSRAFRGDGR